MEKLNRMRLTREMLAELGGYTQILAASSEIPKPSKKFMAEALRGLLQNQSVLLSHIAQGIGGPRKLLYRLQYLSHHLTSRRWDPLSTESSYLRWANQKINPDTVIALDTGDIAKQYARKMPGLSRVWDGSRKDIANGYFLVEIEAIAPNGRHTPLYLDTLSTRKASYVSQNHQIDFAIDFVRTHIGSKGIWVFDRGADDAKRFKFMEERELSWVIRARGDRLVERWGFPYLKAKAISQWARRLKPEYQFTLKAQGKNLTVKAATLPVCLPEAYETSYNLVVVWTDKKRPWYLMTQLAITKPKDIKKIVLAYFARWGVEDAARVIKQCFDLENIRLLTFDGIRKMVWLALWAYGFLCHIGHWPKQYLNLLFSQLDTLWSWQDLRIIYYRVATAISKELAWPPPKNRGFLEEAISA